MGGSVPSYSMNELVRFLLSIHPPNQQATKALVTFLRESFLLLQPVTPMWLLL